MIITYATKPGKNKTQSQDRILVNDESINSYAGTMNVPLKRLCIADGVGGVPGGYEASDFVINEFLKEKNYKNGRELKEYLFRVNDELIKHAAAMEEKKAMATTFTGLARIDRHIWIMHAGNTRLYSFAEGRLQQLTEDHTNFRALQNSGVLGTDEPYAEKNVIYCCFGTGRREYLKSLAVEEYRPEVTPEFLMLTSDGVHDYIEEEAMERIIAENLDDRNKILAMLDSASKNGSNDDCTVVIARTVKKD